MTVFKPFSLNLKGRLLQVDQPLVMGILNATPDSFFAESRCMSTNSVASRTEALLSQGVDIIDVGACSTRPGAESVTATEEALRLSAALKAIRKISPDIPISVDTFRAEIAKMAVEEYGADIINDISGGDLSDEMFRTVAALRVPYIVMHMRGTPETMQTHCNYPNGVAAGVIAELSSKILELERLGVSDIIVDPGFGFSKTVEQNYTLMNALPALERIFQKPLLVGISRKSMITKALGITPADALPATTALNLYALQQGASILRVHDVPQAKQSIKLYQLLQQCSRSQ